MNYDLAGVLSAGEHIPPGRGLLQPGTVWSPFQSAYLPDSCHWDTSDADCALAWDLLPDQDPDWEMWSARAGIDLDDDLDDDPLTTADLPEARSAELQAAGLRTL